MRVEATDDGSGAAKAKRRESSRGGGMAMTKRNEKS